MCSVGSVGLSLGFLTQIFHVVFFGDMEDSSRKHEARWHLVVESHVIPLQGLRNEVDLYWLAWAKATAQQSHFYYCRHSE